MTTLLNAQDFILNELNNTQNMLSACLEDASFVATLQRCAEHVAQAVLAGHKVFFCGNGGSAAESQHFSAELVGRLHLERPGFASIALTADTAALTAIANDYGYEQVFARQLQALGQAGDVLIALSTSGKSANVIEAVKYAKLHDIHTIAMTGATPASLGELADALIAIPANDTASIQEGHLIIGHILCALVEQHIVHNHDSTQQSPVS